MTNASVDSKLGAASAGQPTGARRVAPPALSVVVPVHDEAGNILSLIEEIHNALVERVDFELIYVDDGSRDATQAELAAAAAHFPRLSIYRHRAGCGQSTALHTGISNARADWVATLDGDGQNPPTDILTLLAARDRAGEPRIALVAGQRARRQDTAIRRLSSRLANFARQAALRDGVRDSGCGLKLMRREAFLALPYFDHMHRFLPALFRRAGHEIALVEVGHRPRAAGRSKYGVANRLFVGIIDLIGVMWLMRRSRLPEIEPWQR